VRRQLGHARTTTHPGRARLLQGQCLQGGETYVYAVTWVASNKRRERPIESGHGDDSQQLETSGAPSCERGVDKLNIIKTPSSPEDYVSPTPKVVSNVLIARRRHALCGGIPFGSPAEEGLRSNDRQHRIPHYRCRERPTVHGAIVPGPNPCAWQAHAPPSGRSCHFVGRSLAS
jgi:hypothetical protein